MTHGSLFSGIGGFDLAAEWMGWENKFHCEWNEFGQKVLKYHFPKSISYADITKTDFTIHRGKIDILTGGFPCQPYSSAGKRLGKEDDRHLFPEMLRAIKEIQPRWIVGENVYGLVNWSGGLVFHEVQADLEAEGYEVFPYLLPACAVNAPHRRDRIWFVAYSNGNGRRCICRQQCKFTSETYTKYCDTCSKRDVANTMCKRHTRSTSNGVQKMEGVTTQWNDKCARSSKRNNWVNFPTVSPLCIGNDGISDRLDSITFPKWRTESIKAGGNAVVPQVVYQIFKTIEQYENLNAWTSQ
jgi:DNA (cytosine-5)-methyltransferase 1